ncbi:hypothetical protein NE697_22955, partial [Phocaeicola vulgatus]|nr:hypothetical protein [Phocaeicola vulgatus]
QANDFQDYNRNEKRTYEALVTGVFCGIFNFSKKRHKKICKLHKPEDVERLITYVGIRRKEKAVREGRKNGNL